MEQFVLYVVMLGVPGYLALRAIRALEVGPRSAAEVERLAKELEKLREAQDDLANRVSALRDEQEFVRQLNTPAHSRTSADLGGQGSP